MMNIKTLLLIVLLSLGIVFPVKNIYALQIADINVPLEMENNRTISMDFKEAKVNDVLKIFSQQSGMNFIASAEVANQTINLYLDKVPVNEALERILSANNLTYEIKPGSNVFLVKGNPQPDIHLMTRIYRLKNATVPSSKIISTLASTDASGTSGSGGTGNAALSSTAGIVAALKAILTKNGKIIEDPRTNSLIITDIPNQFPLIEQTLTRLDVRVPQILIEVEMLDISKNTADLLGAKFQNTPVSFFGPERYSFFPLNEDNVFDDVSLNGQRKFDGEPESGYTAGKLSFAGLAFTLQFLRTQTDTKSLARPRILTLNNETAEIHIKTEEAIGVASTTTSSQGTANSTQEAERAQTGVFLKVTPQANLDTSEITMVIEPKVVQARTGATFGTQTFRDPEERGSRSILRVKDSETIIIGGLVRNEVSDVRMKVPVLSKIPIIGAAFRHKDKSDSQRELVIFITPHIVTENIVSNARSRDITSIFFPANSSSQRLNLINKELSTFESR